MPAQGLKFEPMPPRFLARALLALLALGAALAAPAACAQAGIRLPDRAGPGLDPALARAWLAPEYDRFGFTNYRWRDAAELAQGQRMNWSYSFGSRGSLGLSFGRSRDYDTERQVSLVGRYWLSPDWALRAESTSREPGSLFRLQDFRIGVQRRF